MKVSKILLFSLTITVSLLSCNKDDDPRSANNGNPNANTTVRSGYSESDQTSLLDAAHRLEIPRLRNGANDIFVVHTVPQYGINYCIEYDCQKMASRWTAYQWHSGNSKANWNRNNWRTGQTYNGYGGDRDPFQPDPLIPRAYRLTESAYSSMTGGSFQRGHMLGSADRLSSKEANGQTFYMSNMQPQIAAFNTQGIWYNLENQIRNVYNKDNFRDTLYVVKGGTIEDGQCTISTNGEGIGIRVPKYFFMALLCKNSKPGNGGYKAIAFWMEHKGNTSSNYRQYAISIDELEQKTGIDFFCNLPDEYENPVEASCDPSLWSLK